LLRGRADPGHLAVARRMRGQHVAVGGQHVAPGAMHVDLGQHTDHHVRVLGGGIQQRAVGIGQPGGRGLVGTGLAVAAWFSAVAAGLLNPLTVLFSSVPVVALIPVIARLLGYDTSTVLAIEPSGW